MRNKQVMLGILSYLQKVWETCGVQFSACPSVREADRGLASTESGEAQQVAGYLLGPHGTLRNQLGKLGLSASRLLVLIKGWAGSGRLLLGLDCSWVFLGRWKAGVPEQVFLSSVRSAATGFMRILLGASLRPLPELHTPILDLAPAEVSYFMISDNFNNLRSFCW